MEHTYPNEMLKILYERGSVRHYTDKPIDANTLNWILGAGIHAASGGNLQPYSIIVIEKTTTKHVLAEMCQQKFIATAPVNLLFCIDYRRNARIAEKGNAPYTVPHSFRHFWISFQDVIITAQSICTAADALGLGSCYIGTIMEYMQQSKEIFSLPDSVIPVVLLTLGYPENPPNVRNKLPLDMIVHREKYNDTDINTLYEAYRSREKDWKMDTTPEHVEEFREVCTLVGGKDFGDSCTADVEKKGYFNAIQYRFGLHYSADKMPKGNLDKINTLKKCGLLCFDKWGQDDSSP